MENKWLSRLLDLLDRFHKKPAVQPSPEHRICANCNLRILRNHHWSAKAWIDDPRPRHWDCSDPTRRSDAPPLPFHHADLDTLAEAGLTLTEQLSAHMEQGIEKP